MFMPRLRIFFRTVLVLIVTCFLSPSYQYAEDGGISEPNENQALISALGNLKGAALEKIDYDIDTTATAFADAKNIWTSKRWADIFGAGLAIVGRTISMLGSMLNWEDICRNAENVLDSSEANLEIASLLLMFEEMQQVGEDLQLAIDGPTYNSSMEKMLEDADAYSGIVSIDYEGYKGAIKSHLYMDYGPVAIPQKSADISRKNSGFAKGALEMKRDIADRFRDLIDELSSKTLPATFPQGEAIGQINELARSIRRSRLQGVVVQYETYLRREADYVLGTMDGNLGSIACLEKLRATALSNFDKKMKIEQEVVIHSAASAILDATLLYVGTKYKSAETGEVLGEVKKLGIVSSAMALATSKFFYTDAEEQVYMIPQEMALSLPGEFSTLWMIVNDTISYTRYLMKSLPSKSTKFKTGNDVQTTANLNIRTGPGMGYDVITTLPSGSTGKVIADGDNGLYADTYYWWHVELGGYNGWCAENWLQRPARQSTQTSIFTVVGTVRNADNTLASTGLEVTVTNETRSLVVTTTIGKQEPGTYGAVFIDMGNTSVAAEGDVLKVMVKDGQNVMGSGTYELTVDDVAKAMVIIDLELGSAVIEPAWDVTRDGRIDISDLVLVGVHFGETTTESETPTADVNGDGRIDILDLVLLGVHFGEEYSTFGGAPAFVKWDWRNQRIDYSQYLHLLRRVHAELEKSSDTNAEFVHMKLLLQELIELAQGQIGPTENRLLQNYPNPFNPDTWIPYQLKEDASVVIKIYDSTGELVRRLDLGYKSSGCYLDKDRAAYWDGKNQAGEHMASGTYFYSIKADDFSGTRKMVVRK